MKLYEVRMEEKEFEIWWKTVNDDMEKGESRLILLLGHFYKDPIAALGRMYGLPDSYIKEMSQYSELLENSDSQMIYSIATWRMIQAVLHG